MKKTIIANLFIALLATVLIASMPALSFGEFYAAYVEGFNICNCDSSECDPDPAHCYPENKYCIPNEAEGPPLSGLFVSLGTAYNNERYIIAAMERWFTDGEGADIRIYEVGNLQGEINEPFDVYISSNGEDWIMVAESIKNDSGEIYASIDIEGNSDDYKYIKVVDKSTSLGYSTKSPGSDIDAIEALYEGEEPTTTTTTRPTTSSSTTTSCPCIPNCTANFIAIPTLGSVPLKVHFINLSFGSTSRYMWRFGDRCTSAEENPTHTYTNMGSYNVSLTAYCGNGSFTHHSRENYVRVFSPCPLMNALDNQEDIHILRDQRDSMLGNVFGLVLTSFYYQNSAEVAHILAENPELQDTLRDLVSRNISAVIKLNTAGEISVSENKVDEAIEFLNNLKEKGSPQLKSDINLVIKAMKGRYFLYGLGVRVE